MVKTRIDRLLSLQPNSLRALTLAVLGSLGTLLFGLVSATAGAGATPAATIPPSWEVLPIPRYADYGSPAEFLTLGRVAIVRRTGSPYRTTRDKTGNLTEGSTITEEELTTILKENSVAKVQSLDDSQSSFKDYDTLVLLGAPENNSMTRKLFKQFKLSFKKWDDPRTPEDDFTRWSDFGREGYLLKTARVGNRNVIILAGYDFDDDRKRFYGAGTFYALQSLRQLIVRDGNTVKVKTAEIADKPLIGFRGAMSGFDSNTNKQWHDIAFIAAIKGNANIYWYGNSMGGYNSPAAAKFRYPWTPEQLELYGKFGKWCREHFITMVFCMNGDHVNYAWATPMTFDGKQKDPCHYDPGHGCEPQFTEMWGKLGYAVTNDVDIIAAKFAQLNQAVGGGAMFQAMNEDDVFGLFHPGDKKYYHTETADQKQNAINYGRARGEMLGRIYKKIREQCPDSDDYMTFDPPASLPYQIVLESNEHHERDFLKSMGKTMSDLGVLNRTPILTTGGGTLAEVISNKNIDDFRSWYAPDCKILIHENNFAISHVGANETNPDGPRWPFQRSKDYPAGYRDKELYQRVWGIQWNGVTDVEVLGWCMGQYMWNMLALDKPRIDALATRKVCSDKSYPLVKSFFEDFDRPITYTPDCPVAPLVPISDKIAFKNNGWEYNITYTDDIRVEAQQLRHKLGTLLPQLEAKWETNVCKTESLKHPGYDTYNFCTLYLARGYINGWAGGEHPKQLLAGDQLRDLFLDAYDIDQRYFAGPDVIPGKGIIDRSSYSGSLNHLYVRKLQPPAPTPADSPYHVDVWKSGLLGRFFEAVSATAPADIPDGAARLNGDWGKVEGEQTNQFRTIAGLASIKLQAAVKGRVLVRMKLATGTALLTDSTKVMLTAGNARHEDAVGKPRWITWLLPEDTSLSTLTIKADSPVRVHAVEIYRERR